LPAQILNRRLLPEENIMTRPSTLSRIARTGIAALIVAGTSVFAVAPAQAGNPLNFQTGNGSPTVQLAHYRRPTYRPPVRSYCDTNRQIFRKFRNNGYRDIRFGRNRGKWVVVRADRGRWDFTYRVNRCTGRVIEVNRVRNWPNNGGYYGGGNNGGYYGGGGNNWSFQFQYNF
jgi:hypothetical protein